MSRTAAANPRAQFHHLAQILRGLEEDLRWGLAGSPRIPAAWTEIAQAPVAPAKVKLTLRLDEDVERFFRAMGRGHLIRMNAVLRAFMLARLARVVPGPEDVVYAPTPEERMAEESRSLLSLIARREERRRQGGDSAMIDKAILRALDTLDEGLEDVLLRGAGAAAAAHAAAEVGTDGEA